jgi:hypothetical protein
MAKSEKASPPPIPKSQNSLLLLLLPRLAPAAGSLLPPRQTRRALQ